MARRKKQDKPQEGCGCGLALIFFLACVAEGNDIPAFFYLALIAGLSVSIWVAWILLQTLLSLWPRESPQARFLRAMDISQITNGHDFEHFIAQRLRDRGMKATVTPPTGDQGVDIIAVTRKGTRIAIQTKLHSKRVSNRAVQQVYTGRDFHDCALAVVITNQTFTKSAMELAKKNKVELIGYFELNELENGSHWIYRI
ncbi:MAG: restriction endonuclease [Planctomycetota bacterium]